MRKVREPSGRGDEQEVPESEPKPSLMQEETPEEQDTSNDTSSSFFVVVSYLCPPPPTSEQPPSATEEYLTPTPTPELAPTTPPQTTQEPVEPPSPVAPPASSDDTPSTRTGSGATENSVPTAGAPGASQSTAGTKPSTLPTAKNESGDNKTSITIGVVIAAILISAGIGVWVFRKWKLSPSRQFKSKIRSGSIGGGAAAAAIGSGHGDNPSEYNSYDNIFRPHPHESTVPMTMAGAAATTGVSMMGGMPANEYEYESYDYPSQPPMAHQYHQPHMSMSSAAGSVTDYGQYRYPPSTSSVGYDPNVVAHSMAAHGGGSPGSGHHLHGYGSQDYSQNDQFLRELRE
ncbi:hypothetical protein BGZ59_011597 [Podila verticillata]|nr:hypothetical protein BGZ59_011597 [Podila verticillata]